jgi:hypothetical protein
MALDTAFYLVTRDIAIRSGLVDVRYRTLDGRFILDNKDLSRVRFTTDEYISGLKGVEKISEAEAQTLIAQGGYKKGLGVENPNKELPTGDEEEPVVDSEAPSEETQGESTTEQTEDEQAENNEETNEKEEEE